MEALISRNERKIQAVVHSFLSDPAKVYKTVSGKRLQILSPGRKNVFEGPDYLDVGILIDGLVNVGDAEFHRRTSDWLAHCHDENPNYKDVILHIVFEDDRPEIRFPEKLILNPDDLDEENKKSFNKELLAETPEFYQDLQQFALLRLLRRASDAKKILDSIDLASAMTIFVKEYLIRYDRKRRRPIYDDNALNDLLSSVSQSPIVDLLEALKEDIYISIPDKLAQLIRTKIANEGKNLRMELIVNGILPLAICLASEERRIDLFLWYWSTTSVNLYGALNRRFPNVPQNYIWQQQGMLEYLKERGNKSNIVSEALKNYGFAEVLSFYRLGRPPFQEFSE